MTVHQLINELLYCPMDSEVEIQIDQGMYRMGLQPDYTLYVPTEIVASPCGAFTTINIEWKALSEGR